MPGLVGDDGERLVPADVVAREDAFLAVAAGGDLQIDRGVAAHAGLGVGLPLAAGVEDEAGQRRCRAGRGDLRGGFLVAGVGGFEDASEEVLIEGIVDGGEDLEVGGLDEPAVMARKGPRHNGNRPGFGG